MKFLLVSALGPCALQVGWQAGYVSPSLYIYEFSHRRTGVDVRVEIAQYDLRKAFVLFGIEFVLRG